MVLAVQQITLVASAAVDLPFAQVHHQTAVLAVVAVATLVAAEAKAVPSGVPAVAVAHS